MEVGVIICFMTRRLLLRCKKIEISNRILITYYSSKFYQNEKDFSIAVICCVVAMTGIFTSCTREDGDWAFTVKLDPSTPDGIANNYAFFFESVVIDNMKASADRYTESSRVYIFRGEKKEVRKRAEAAFNKAIDALEASRASHPGVLMGGTKINLVLSNRDTNADEIILTRTLKED